MQNNQRPGSSNSHTKPRKPSVPKIAQPISPRYANAVDEEALQILLDKCFLDQPASALSELIAQSKQKRVQEWLNDHPKRALLRTLLQHETPKVRKNAARLFGNLSRTSDLPALLDAISQEETTFVLPSLILALGQFSDERSQQSILAQKQYWEAQEQTIETQKHIREILSACEVALSKFQTHIPCAFVEIPSSFSLEVRANQGCGTLLKKEAADVGLVAPANNDTLILPAQSYKQAFNLRCMQEVLIPLDQIPPLSDFSSQTQADKWALTIQKQLLAFADLLSRALTPKPISYRIEIKGLSHAQRTLVARAVSNAMSSEKQLLNSVSNYDAELRFDCTDKSCKLYAKLFRPADERFAYRVKTLPASIHPVMAASLVRFALPFLSPNSKVIDPCCGSATLLIERAKLLPLSYALGVDKAQNAVACARQNVSQANLPIDVIGGDLTVFRPNQPFDELIANLPFGTRVGTHESITALHHALFSRLDALLVPNGTAILYTTQRMLCHRISQKNEWILQSEMLFHAGGLTPWGMVFRKKS